MTRIAIVDENDSPIGFKERSALENGDIYRVSALWLTNSAGEVLMAQRAFTKKNDPGLWGPAVAGTVDEGEGYEENIVKETREEIGLEITIEQLKVGPKIRRHGKNNYFSQWYFYSVDMPAGKFTIPHQEVVQVRWFPVEELKKRIKDTPQEFIPSANLWAEQFLK